MRPESCERTRSCEESGCVRGGGVLLAPLGWPRGGKAPGLEAGAPLGRRALAVFGEYVGEARAAVDQACVRLEAC